MLVRKSKQSITKTNSNLDRQTAKISALSYVSKYEFWTGEDGSPKSDLLEKAAAIKRLKYFPLGKELKKQTNFTEKRYKELHNDFESNKIEEDKTQNKRIRANSNLVYYNYFTFFKCYNIKEFAKRSFDSK